MQHIKVTSKRKPRHAAECDCLSKCIDFWGKLIGPAAEDKCCSKYGPC